MQAVFTVADLQAFRRYGLAHSQMLEGCKFFIGVEHLDDVAKRECVVYFGESPSTFDRRHTITVKVKQILEI